MNKHTQTHKLKIEVIMDFIPKYFQRNGSQRFNISLSVIVVLLKRGKGNHHQR